MQTFLFFILFILFTSCGGKDPTESAIFQADYYLTSGKCDEAQDVLDDAGWSSSARYIGAYSNVYACFAGFSELTAIFNGNLDLLNTGSKEDIFKSFASFSTSNETTADSFVYTNMDQGIHTILNAVGSSPSAALRNQKYGRKAGTDLNSQALYMTIFQFGKFLAFYGNTDTDGVKGVGGQGNNCFINYTNSDVITFITSGNTGACNSATEGSSFLDFTTEPALATRRVCEGVIYFNNLLDILRNLDFGSSDMTLELSKIVATVDVYLDTLSAHTDLAPYLSMTSKNLCEDEIISNPDGLEKFYAFIFEVLLQ